MPRCAAPKPIDGGDTGGTRSGRRRGGGRTLPAAPPDLAYAVDERPPALQLLLIGLQYALMTAIYLVRLSDAA